MWEQMRRRCRTKACKKKEERGGARRSRAATESIAGVERQRVVTDSSVELVCLALTCVTGQRRSRDDRLVFAEVRALPHVVLEGAFGLVAVQGGGVVLRVEAVVRRHPLQAAER